MDAAQILADAIQAGVDLEMLEHNLGLAPEERARQHDAALALVLELKQAGERMRANDLALA
jgi:hypothetical protein